MIIYDLRNSEMNYNGLFEAIKGLSGNWKHPMVSTWFVSSEIELSTQDIYDKLKPFIDDGDNILVIDMNNPKNRQGWMQKTFWQWLNVEQQ